MNTSAIAMAADTAMSIQYETGTKTYTRTRKLLPLHKTEPVAVMVWDAPSHYGLPWEVIVGEFRKEDDKSLNKLDDYVNAFFEFVDTEASKWVPANYEGALIAEVIDPEIQLLQKLWADRLDSMAGPLPGQKATYTVTLANGGGSPYTGAQFADDLAGVLDDATLRLMS